MPQAAGGTAAQRRRRRTRVAIARIAVELFAEHGYAATSALRVAAAADVSRSTLFRYFTDKDELVFALEEQLLADAEAAVGHAAPDVPAWAALRQATVSLAAEVTAMRDLLLTRERVIAEAPALQVRAAAEHHRWEQVLARALQQGRAVDALDAALLAKAAVACFEVAQQRWLTEVPPSDLAELLTETFTQLPPLLTEGP